MTATVAVTALAVALVFQWKGWWSSAPAGLTGGQINDILGGGSPRGGGSLLGRAHPGKFNAGPRIGALCLLLFGQVALTGGAVAGAVHWFIHLMAGWAGQLFGWAFHPSVGHAAAHAFPWLFTATLALLWLAAFLPDSVLPGRMGWELAWAGVLIPASLPAIPGAGGGGLVSVFHFLTTLTRHAVQKGVGG